MIRQGRDGDHSMKCTRDRRLLVEAAQMDDTIGPKERARIRTLLEQRFFTRTNPEDQSSCPLAAAETETEGPAQWHRFTSTLKDRFSDEERIQMIEMLWEIVLRRWRIA